ncbi:MAG: NUDIX domain-containing protein [Micromonosporaceae bacterium]
MDSTVRAAGGLLWRERDGVIEVALVHRPRYQDWTLPKGTLEADESPLRAAHREVIEETGVRPVVGVRLLSTSYQVPTTGGAADKTVDYWAMRAGTTSPFTPSPEVDQMRWLPLDEAATTLTYHQDGAVLEAFGALPRPLRTVVLLHHAPASGEWDGPDVTRPLDDVGARTAERLTGLLALFAPVRAVSATPRRCVQTLEPLAAGRNLEIEPDSVFDAESHARAPEVTANRLLDLASGDTGTVVVCSQAGVIPDTVALLADSDGLALPTVRTPAGNGWVLSFAERLLVAADFLSIDIR